MKLIQYFAARRYNRIDWIAGFGIGYLGGTQQWWQAIVFMIFGAFLSAGFEWWVEHHE